MNNDHETRRDAIINSAAEQFRAKFEKHFREITKAAEQSFVGDNSKEEPIAILRATVKWGALAAATKVKLKLSWSSQASDESEEEVDPLQSKLGLPEASPKVRAIADEIRNASPAVQRAAVHVVNALHEENKKKEGAK